MYPRKETKARANALEQSYAELLANKQQESLASRQLKVALCGAFDSGPWQGSADMSQELEPELEHRAESRKVKAIICFVLQCDGGKNPLCFSVTMARTLTRRPEFRGFGFEAAYTHTHLLCIVCSVYSRYRQGLGSKQNSLR